MKKFSFILVLVLCLAGAAAASDMIKAAGSELIDSSGKKTDTVPSQKIIGFYFSAHWCPPCKTFTPKLVEFYSALKKEGHDFEIIFVSSDKSKTEMMQYMKETEMPWAAIPYDSEETKAVKQIWRTELNLRGIPSLVILRDGQVIAKEGRRDVTASGTAAYQKWLTMEPETPKLPAETEASTPDTPALPIPAPEKKEMRMDELKAVLIDLDGKVIKTTINFVSSFEKVSDKQFRAGCAYYDGGTIISTEYALIPEEGAELFKTKAGKGVGSQQTVYFRVNTKKPVRSGGISFRLEAVGTRYSQIKNEYSW